MTFLYSSEEISGRPAGRILNLWSNLRLWNTMIWARMLKKQQQLCEKTLWINHLLMDVEPWCYRWIGFDGLELWLGWGTEHLTVLKTLKDAARNHLWKIHLHLICLVPFCAQVEMDPILARISLFLSSPSGVQKCPSICPPKPATWPHLLHRCSPCHAFLVAFLGWSLTPCSAFTSCCSQF